MFTVFLFVFVVLDLLAHSKEEDNIILKIKITSFFSFFFSFTNERFEIGSS